MTKKKPFAFKTDLIRIKNLCDKAGIGYFKLYFRRIGAGKNKRESPLSLQDRTALLNAFVEDVTPLVNDLGFDIRVTRLKN